MPGIQKLQITSFRNLSRETLAPAPRLNLVCGENGSGKSSILEAIHFLGLGRSFRNTRQVPLIQHDARHCSVFGELDQGVSLGVSRSVDEPPQLRVQGNRAQSPAELAKHLPLQLLNAEAFRLLEGGPKTRRQFVDWGVFHVEHRFHAQWREYQRCLQNRNILLKRKAARAELEPWTQELIRHATEIDRCRKAYLARFLPTLESLLATMISLDQLTFVYARGWSEEEALVLCFERHLDRDYGIGHTSTGPHRADLKIRLGGQNASDILSRGQQKLVVSAMKLAQGAFLAQESDRQCLYLIDDLAAELDQENRRRVCRVLHDLGGQVYLTGTEEKALLDCLENSGFSRPESKLFHVKHGKITSEIMAAGQQFV